MPGAQTSTRERATVRRTIRHGAAVLAATIFALLAIASTASAAKQAVDYFGGVQGGTGTLAGEFKSAPYGVAVNDSGAGGVPAGTIYVTDPGPTFGGGFEAIDGEANRIERFQRDDNGTPGDTADDTYRFIAVWGAGVDSTLGGSDYQICTVAANCQDGLASGGNGTPAGNGSLDKPTGIVVDQETGDVYVLDTGNHRINVYEANGTFLESFGYDVVASGPDNVPGPNEQQKLTVKASGGHFSLAFNGKATGARGIGHRESGSKVVEQVVTTQGKFSVGEGISGNAIAPGTTITTITPTTLGLSQPATFATTNEDPLFGDNFPHDPTAQELESALNALPSIGGVGGSVSVSGGPGDSTGSNPYTIEFANALGGQDTPLLVPADEGLTNTGNASAVVTSAVNGGAYEICNGSAGDVCRTGAAGSATGEFGEGGPRGGASVPGGIAISPPDGNPTTGSVFATDATNQRVNTYALDGSAPGSFGSPATFGKKNPYSIAVDSRGIVYVAVVEPFANTREIQRYDSRNADGGGVGSLPPITSLPSRVEGLAVDPDSDGAGPDTDVLYALTAEGSVLQFGPVNSPGLSAPPSAADDTHGTNGAYSSPASVAVEPSTGRIYVGGNRGNTSEGDQGVYVLDNAGATPTASLDSFSETTSHSVKVNATIDPNGPPSVSYHVEYSLNGTDWKSTSPIVLGSQETPQPVSVVLDPPGGLESSTLYHVRVVAAKKFQPPAVTPEQTFTTLGEKPLVETTGSPVRTATTAHLEGRVAPRNLATTYHFEYGTQGPCDVNPCESSEAHAAGSGGIFEFVSQSLSGLQPNTTYHYRVVAESAAPGSPSFGEDRTVTTRASDQPLSHGHFPGPPGSDRAWEQVSIPDSGGNPVTQALGISSDGNRAFYRVAGGTPISSTGTFVTPLYAERTPSGWHSENIFPPRDQLIAQNWLEPSGSPDLSNQVVINFNNVTGAQSVWRLQPGQPASKVFQPPTIEFSGPLIVSEDASRVLVRRGGTLDPAHPVIGGGQNLYDVSTGTPKLIDLLPDGTVPACGARGTEDENDFPGGGPSNVDAARHWISANGSIAFFPSTANNCSGAIQIYMREIDAEQTRLVSGPPLSGLNCGAVFLKSTPTAAFFRTSTRLQSTDTDPSSCSTDQDVYRYEVGDGALTCVTCVVPGRDVDLSNAMVSPNGARVYFNSPRSLVPGAKAGIYRVNALSGSLAYVAPGANVGERIGDEITPDGSVLFFAAISSELNVIGGEQNGGSRQLYRYDDRDRSLVCVSCPQGGSAPIAALEGQPKADGELGAANQSTLSADGETLVFQTTTPLVSADQNTAREGQDVRAGMDVYEWRNGRLLLVTDGLNNWTVGQEPAVNAITPSGSDVFFTASTQYTPDALDGYKRLYDARIGGGIDFPARPKPCPLEVCQGTPKGTPEEVPPGTDSFQGAGNLKQAAKAKKHGKKHRHHKKQERKHRAKHDRRANR